MKISNLTLTNFRSIEKLSVEFPSFYTAISGKNNSGKSNLLRVLKMLFEPERRFRYKDEEINFPQHFPAWKEKNSVEPIKFSITLQVDRVRDSAIFKLADEFFKIGEDVPSITLHLSAEYNRDKDQPELVATHCENLLDSFKSRTLFKTIRNSGAFQFYNSTEPEDPFGPRNQLTDLFGELSKADREQLVKDRDKLSKTISSF